MRTLLPFLQWLPLWKAPGTLRADALAGLTGALLVLPQGVAFAALAGLPAQYGLYAAMVPCIVAALFGSSRLMVTGPANAISLALLTLVAPMAEVGSRNYIALVTTLTFMTGTLMLLLGLARAGALVARIPESVIRGFTAGAAVLIIGSQIAPALGIARAEGTTIASALGNAWARSGELAPMSLAITVVTIACVQLARVLSLRGPAILLGLVAGTLAAAAASRIDAGWRIARVVHGEALALPPLTMPTLDESTLRNLFWAAITLTLLALTEATAIGRAIAVRHRERFSANQEIVGQGLANLAGAFFSAYPTSGSFNRSTANVEAGARTPMAAICAAVILMVLLAFFADLTRHIPLAAIAGVLLIVGWRLVDIGEIRHVWQAEPQARWPMVATFTATLAFPLELALLLGMACAAAVHTLGRWRSGR